MAGQTMADCKPQSDGPAKLLGLEIIRFACAMTVLIFHYKHFALVPGLHVNRGIDMPLAVPLALFYTYGSYGVQVFWCISGFIFYWKYADALAARRIEPKRFFWLRFSRLYPLHFVTLLTVAGLQPIYIAIAGQPFNYDISASRFVAHLFLADQWGASRALSFNAPIWSVSAEVLVYAAFFILVRVFAKSLLVIMGAIIASLFCLWSGHAWPAVTCAGYFFAGGAAAMWLESAGRERKPDGARRVALAIIGTCVIASFFIDLGGADRSPMSTWLMAITPPILFLAAQDLPALERWEQPIRTAGNLTYSTYLVHFPLQLAIATFALAAGLALPVREPWFLFAYLAATIIIGRIVFLRFEAPMQSMIRALTLRRATSPAMAKPA